jgi:hypothetical protein
MVPSDVLAEASSGSAVDLGRIQGKHVHTVHEEDVGLWLLVGGVPLWTLAMASSIEARFPPE